MLSYWPDSAFNGLHMSVGIRTDEITDVVTEAGYALTLWKDICLSISLRVPVIRSIKEEHIGADIIKIGINYRFGRTHMNCNVLRRFSGLLQKSLRFAGICSTLS